MQLWMSWSVTGQRKAVVDRVRCILVRRSARKISLSLHVMLKVYTNQEKALKAVRVVAARDDW
jgi:hypothetical protein